MEVIKRARVALFAGGTNVFETAILDSMQGAKSALETVLPTVGAHAGAVANLLQVVTESKTIWPGDEQVITLEAWCKSLNRKASLGMKEGKLRNMIAGAFERESDVVIIPQVIAFPRTQGVEDARLPVGDPAVAKLRAATIAVTDAFATNRVDVENAVAVVSFAAGHLPLGEPSIAEFEEWASLCKAIGKMNAAIEKVQVVSSCRG